jgi:hypothetical protein
VILRVSVTKEGPTGPGTTPAEIQYFPFFTNFWKASAVLSHPVFGCFK